MQQRMLAPLQLAHQRHEKRQPREAKTELSLSQGGTPRAGGSHRGYWRKRSLRVLEGRKERSVYWLKMHSHVPCAPAAGCCLAAATLLNCFPSPAKTGIDGLHKLNGWCKRARCFVLGGGG